MERDCERIDDWQGGMWRSDAHGCWEKAKHVPKCPTPKIQGFNAAYRYRWRPGDETSRAAINAASAIALTVASGKLSSSRLGKVVSRPIVIIGFNDLRRGVDLRSGKPRSWTRVILLRLFRLNDRFSAVTAASAATNPRRAGTAELEQ